MGNNQENQGMPFMPNNYLFLSIFTTVCCCLPFGIYAIILSSKVNTLYLAGQYDLAVQKSQEAKKFSMIGIGLGLAFIVIYMIAYVLLLANSDFY